MASLWYVHSHTNPQHITISFTWLFVFIFVIVLTTTQGIALLLMEHLQLGFSTVHSTSQKLTGTGHICRLCQSDREIWIEKVHIPAAQNRNDTGRLANTRTDDT